MADKQRIAVTALDRDAMLDDEGNLRAAFLCINLLTLEINFHWLPELFREPMPEPLRKEIAARLRMYADRVESGELEREMQKYMNINDSEKHN